MLQNGQTLSTATGGNDIIFGDGGNDSLQGGPATSESSADNGGSAYPTTAGHFTC